MDEQRVPNLQEMDEQQAHRFLTDLYSRHIPEEEYNVRHPKDYVMEMPQSGERFRGRENMRAFQEAPPPRRRLCRCAECWSERNCGWSKRSSTTATGRNLTWWSSANCAKGRCGETDGTSRSRSRRLSGGPSGSSGWKCRLHTHLNFREHLPSTHSGE